MKGPTRESPQKSALKSATDFCKKNSCHNNNKLIAPATFDEAKACCKARKRKERQESISSLCQERKVIRSNSEERPTQKKHLDNKAIRRVSSSEDFQKANLVISCSERNVSPNRQISDEECERRRSHERFSKPLLMKSKNKGGRRLKVRCLKTKFKPEPEAKKQASEERSPSPVQQLDLSTLHEQVDCSEPLLSCANHQITENTETLPGLSVASNRLLSSPRNSIIATHRIYLDPDFENKNPLELKLQKLTKQINSVKKKIKKYEQEFETKHGHKLSHADKLNDKTIRKAYLDLSKLKKEQKQVIEVWPNTSEDEDASRPRNLLDTLNDIEKKLSQKRELSHRSHNLDQMSNEQLLEEKVAVQKALLYLESIHGRPDNKDDRNMARPIYDRYRTLKRMLSKAQSGQTNELATIHEDETMNFVVATFTPQLSEVTDSEKSLLTDSSDTDTSSIGENLHSLSKVELIEQHRIVSEEKKELRRTIKVFEAEVQQKSGRMIQKDDKTPMEHVYVAYKKVKAKLKLLDALVGKQP